MKRFISLILCVVLILNFSFMSGMVSFGILANAEETNSSIPQPVDLKSREDFSVGINIHQRTFSSYPEAYLEQQIHAAARMGSEWIRFGGSIPEDGDWSYIDSMVGLCNKYGLKIVMCLYPAKDVSLEYITIFCETFAYRYNGEDGRGFVDVFQVWNEVDQDLLKAKYSGSAPAGDVETHYFTVPVDGAADLPEYLEFFKAAEKGIHSEKSNSKFSINFCAYHTGMISYFLRNGLDVDLVGWDFYINNPYNRENAANKLEDGYALVQEKLVEPYNIPIMIYETNVNTHNMLSEDLKETDFGMDVYQTLIDHLYIAYNKPWIKGVIIYELLDEPGRGVGKPEGTFGLIKNYSSDGEIGAAEEKNEKSIFKELQKLLGGDTNLPLIKRSEIDLKPYEKLVVNTADDSNISYEDNNDSSSNSTSTSIPDIDLDDNKNDIESDNVFSDTEVIKETEEVIVENVINPVKNLKQRETNYEIPWLLLILSGIGMLLLAGGVVATFVIIDKKKAKKSLEK